MYSVRKAKMLGLLNSRQHFLNTICIGKIFFYFSISVLCNLFADIVMLQVIRSLFHGLFHAAVEDKILPVFEIFHELRLEVGQQHAFRSHDIQGTEGNTGLDAFQGRVEVQPAGPEDAGHFLHIFYRAERDHMVTEGMWFRSIEMGVE